LIASPPSAVSPAALPAACRRRLRRAADATTPFSLRCRSRHTFDIFSFRLFFADFQYFDAAPVFFFARQRDPVHRRDAEPGIAFRDGAERIFALMPPLMDC